MATNNAVNTSLAGQTGTGNFVGSISPSVTTPVIITSLNDANSNTMISFNPLALAVNYFQFANGVSGGSVPEIAINGSDTNVDFSLRSKGTGTLKLLSANTTNPVSWVSGTALQHTTNWLISNTSSTRNVTLPDASGTLLMTGQAISTVPSIAFSSTSGVIGTTTNDNAAAGSVGEFVSSTVLAGSAVAATSGNPVNITSISLTAGDWDVTGVVDFLPAAGTIPSQLITWISTTSATLPTRPNEGALSQLASSGLAASTTQALVTGQIRLSLSATTTVYLSATAVFSVSTLGVYGFIGARRRR